MLFELAKTVVERVMTIKEDAVRKNKRGTT